MGIYEYVVADKGIKEFKVIKIQNDDPRYDQNRAISTNYRRSH